MSIIVRIAVLLALAGTAAALIPSSAGAAGTVNVSLTEFAVTPSVTTSEEGDFTFATTNNGVLQHNLLVIQSNLAPGSLPRVGYDVDESAVNVVAGSSDLSGGGSEDVAASLTAGNYVLICNLPGHYLSNMYVGFVVTAGPAPTDSPTGEPTDLPGGGGTTEPTATVGEVFSGPTGTGPYDGSSSAWWLLMPLAAFGAAGIGLALFARRRLS